MRSSYQPLSDVIGPENARFSVTLTSSIVDKIKNTYQALKGRFPIHGFSLHSLSQLAQSRKHRYGILDFFPFLGLDILLFHVITNLRRLIVSIWTTDSISRALSTLAFIFLGIPAAILFTASCIVMLGLRLATTLVAGVIAAAMVVSTLLPFLQIASYFAEKNLLTLASKIPFTGVKVTSEEVYQQLANKTARLTKNSTELILSIIAPSTIQNVGRVEQSETQPTITATINFSDVLQPEQNDKAIGFNALFQLDYDGVAGQCDPDYIPNSNQKGN